MGGKIGDISKIFDDEQDLIKFAEEIYLAARIPTIIQPPEPEPEPESDDEDDKSDEDEGKDEDEEEVAEVPEAYLTPLNMVCVN